MAPTPWPRSLLPSTRLCSGHVGLIVTPGGSVVLAPNPLHLPACRPRSTSSRPYRVCSLTAAPGAADGRTPPPWDPLGFAVFKAGHLHLVLWGVWPFPGLRGLVPSVRTTSGRVIKAAVQTRPWTRSGCRARANEAQAPTCPEAPQTPGPLPRLTQAEEPTVHAPPRSRPPARAQLPSSLGPELSASRPQDLVLALPAAHLSRTLGT